MPQISEPTERGQIRAGDGRDGLQGRQVDTAIEGEADVEAGPIDRLVHVGREADALGRYATLAPHVGECDQHVVEPIGPPVRQAAKRACYVRAVQEDEEEAGLVGIVGCARPWR